MLSLIKFAASFITPPGFFILIIVILAVWTLRSSRRWGIIWLGVGLLIYLCSIPVVSDALARSVEQQYIPPTEVQGDSIILLTGGVITDTPAFVGKGTPTDETAGRIIVAAAIHNKYNLPIIIAGGQVYKGSGNESQITKNALLSIGVDESSIILEDTSKTTAENAEHVRTVLNGHGFTSPILVTSAIHMPRAVKEFENNGITVVPYPAAYLANTLFTHHAGQLTPSDHALAKTGHALKEIIGLIVAGGKSS